MHGIKKIHSSAMNEYLLRQELYFMVNYDYTSRLINLRVRMEREK